MLTKSLPTRTSTKTKFMSLALALALICSMLVALPSTASAMILPSSTIVVDTNEVPKATLMTVVGQTISVGGEIGPNGPENFVINPVEDPANPGTVFGVDWTVAYLLNDASDPDIATVNKRTGLLTPTAEGTVLVDVWLVNGTIAMTPGLPSNVVGTPATMTINIFANSSNLYGAQGNSQTVLMNTINGAAFTGFLIGFNGDSATGFQNFLMPLTPASDNLAFDFTMAAGTGPNFDTFLTNNAGNIQLFTSDAAGNTIDDVAMLTSDNEGILTFTVPIALPTNTLTLNMDTTTLAPGSYLLRFTPDFRGNNVGRVLDVNVDFVFSI